MAKHDDHIKVTIGPMARVVWCDLCPSRSPFSVLVKAAVWKHGYWYGIGQISKAKAEVRRHIDEAHT